MIPMRFAFARATACMTLMVLAACGRQPPAPAPVPVDARNVARDTDAAAMRAWLERMLTCGDREFLRSGASAQRARLAHMPGVSCEANADGAPLRCAISPPLTLAQADIAWFVIGVPQHDLATIILPAPKESLRTAISAGTGTLSPGTDLGDTTVQCALTDDALRPGAIAGTVQREGDPSAAVRVCAFELAEGVPTCTQTQPGERAYRIENLSRGDYLVLAIPGDAPDGRIGYTDCDPMDIETPCSHELKVVVVEAGRTTAGIDPADLRMMEEAGDWPQPPPAE
jgi:hypothetical protein